MAAETDMIAALLGSASGLEIFEELRFVWEYLAAAAPAACHPGVRTEQGALPWSRRPW